MTKSDKHGMLYIAIMTLFLSGICLGCNILAYYGTPDVAATTSGGSRLPLPISTSGLIAIGVIVAAVDGIAADIVSSFLAEKIASFANIWRFIIPTGAFVITLGLSVWIAILLGK